MKPPEKHQGEAARGIIYNIQRYSIHDGPGIRTTVFFKGCPLRCFWCQNPESQSLKPEIFLNRDNCARCGSCVAACPAGASTLSGDRLRISRDRCAGCGRCAEACPNGARSLVGSYLTADEIMEEVIRDISFYRNSGGGVTFSGGEPLAQPEFVLSLAQKCKEAGLHTALDTCGHAAWPTMERVLGYIDLVLFDIKCLDAGRHLEATGQSNETILENARRVARCRPMRVRVPVITGFNDSAETIRAIARFVRTELGEIDIDLFRYNKLGENKYERLDRPPVRLAETDEDFFRELEDIAGSSP